MAYREESSKTSAPRTLYKNGIEAVMESNNERAPMMESMFAQGLSHELGNLMTTIIGNATLLRNMLSANHPGISKLIAIEQAADQAAMLALQAAENAQGRQITIEPVNLNTIVYHVLLAEEQRLAPRVRLVRYINPDLWRAAAGYKKVAEIALELVLNAVESISEKGRVYIGTRNVDFRKEPPPIGMDLRRGRYVMLTVEDNGCGMSPEVRRRIFEQGFTTKPNRAGMGLKRVRNTVSVYGGLLTVNGGDGQGTVVRVYLPAHERDEDVASVAFDNLPRGSETILLVDDERMIVDIADETLTRLGYHIITANNGLDAVETARTHDGKIDLILLDMVMPVMGGAEAYPLLRESCPDARVIVCTGLDQEIVTGSVLDNERTSFLLKPFRPAALANEVRRVLDVRDH